MSSEGRWYASWKELSDNEANAAGPLIAGLWHLERMTIVCRNRSCSAIAFYRVKRAIRRPFDFGSGA